MSSSPVAAAAPAAAAAAAGVVGRKRPRKNDSDDVGRRDTEPGDQPQSSRNNNNNNNNRPRRPQQQQQQQQHRIHWKDAPSFLDATASVSATTFASRRLPELQRLYQATITETKDATATAVPVTETPLLSGGGKRSSRHLRRRTTAVESKRHRHRYPRNMSTSNRNKTNPEEGSLGDEDGADEDCPDRMPFHGKTRKSRRKKHALLLKSHAKWLSGRGKNQPTATESATDAASSTTKWLITHLWHAKRFHISTMPLWDGWRVPLAHANRGSRAALRLSQQRDDDDNREYVMLRDISWERQPLLLSATNIRTEHDLAWLLQSLQRVCPDLATSQSSSHLNKAFLCGSIVKECVLHGLDQFPRGAIGPVLLRLIVLKKSDNANDDKSRQWVVEIRHHPCIRSAVIATMSTLINEFGGRSGETPTLQWIRNNENSYNVSPRICFRLYGDASTTILNHLIRPDENEQPGIYHGRALIDLVLNGDAGVPHGTVSRIQNATFGSATGTSINIKHDEAKETRNSKGQHGKQFLEALVQQDPLSASIGMDPSSLVLVYQAPRALDCPANRAMSGWEIYCDDMDHAQRLWMAMVVFDSNAGRQRNRNSVSADSISCCSIGLVEEDHLRMECEPPLVSFPRDFVDTDTSRMYWGRTEDLVTTTQGDMESLSWKYIRSLCEGGWGRLPLQREWIKVKTKSVAFQDLAQHAETTNCSNCSVVVVRNSFCQPFVDAIQQCSQSHQIEIQTTNKHVPDRKPHRRRRRRAVQPVGSVLVSPPMSNEQRESFRNACQQMYSTLSLPAVINCHIRMTSKGTLLPGDDIVAWRHPPDSHGIVTLGRITAGFFSTSRGVVHGTGVVGAAPLLKYLIRCSAEKGQIHCGRIVPMANGQRSYQLAVGIRQAPAGTSVVQADIQEASLSVLVD